MKTKILKLVLPVMAFVMAGILAFASENKESSPNTLLITGYIHQNGVCRSVQVDCTNDGATSCTSSGLQVYKNNTCGTKMFTWP